jgi:hypothetical protein
MRLHSVHKIVDPSTRARSSATVYGVAAVIVLGFTFAGLLAVLIYGVVITGRIAREFGEDPAHWQWRMLPFGIFGPMVVRAILIRRNRGDGGGWA